MPKLIDREPLYTAVDRWIEAALRSDDSLFTPGRVIWSATTIEDLYERFNLQPDVSGDSFEDKFRRQLEGASAETYQLAGELLYVHLLAPIDIGGSTKLGLINRILAWSPSPLELGEGLGQTLDGGIANVGVAFKTLRPHQLWFLIEFVRHWKRLEQSNRDHLLKDPWPFKEMLWKLPLNGAQSQRNALLHFVHPETFEPITSQDAKASIVRAFAELSTGASDDVDRRIQQIRQALEGRYGEGFNFYGSEVETLWKEGIKPDQWDEFIYWAKRFHSMESFDEQERIYKLKIAERVSEAHDAVCSDSPDWQEKLRQSFASQNLAHHFMHASFMRWCEMHPDDALSGLRALWEPVKDVGDRVESFLDYVPRKDVVSGPSNRLSLASFLLMAIDPYLYAPYRSMTFDRGFELSGVSPPPKNVGDTERYLHALDFLDQIREQAANRGLALRDRLDAQSVLWAITQWDPLAEWSEHDQRAFLKFRGEIAPDPTLGELAGQLLLDVSYLQRVERLLEDKGQLIFYGPPGTGKTYVARELATFYAGDEGSVELVQFHPSYAYEDFIEGYRPQLVNGQPGFALAEGPLKRIARAAMDWPDERHVLVIDELNRGNVAKVLGELYFLLEYRDEEINLQYSAEPFRLPPNLWIIGTMNTADRSIALIDAALRRRVYFVPFIPDEPPVQGLLRRWLKRENPEFEWVADMVDQANVLLDNRHMAIGPSYFMNANLSDEWVELIWEHSVLPYIAEQFFGEEDRLEQFEFSTLRGFASSDPLEDEIAGDALS